MDINFNFSAVLERVKYLLHNCSKNTQFLFYSALELRYAIEILLYDWLKFSIEGSHSLAEYLKDLYGNDIPEGSIDVPPNPKIISEKKSA